jgi:hypothetical protein
MRQLRVLRTKQSRVYSLLCSHFGASANNDGAGDACWWAQYRKHAQPALVNPAFSRHRHLGIGQRFENGIIHARALGEKIRKANTLICFPFRSFLQ